MKCKVCGTELNLIKPNHYVARSEEVTGLGPVLTSKEEAKLFDAFDCNVCGCQNIVGERKRKYEEKQENEEEIDEDFDC